MFQIMGLDESVAAQDGGPFQAVFQFPDIAFPRIFFQPFNDLGIDAFDVFLGFFRKLLEEIFG